jgi:hypothetical protein
MANNKFMFGFVMGALAAVAAKKLYDNREEVCEVLKEKTQAQKKNFRILWIMHPGK